MRRERIHALQSIKTCDVSKVSAKELVETFREIKSKHDTRFRVAQGSTFLTVLVVYCFCEISHFSFVILVRNTRVVFQCVSLDLLLCCSELVLGIRDSSG